MVYVSNNLKMSFTEFRGAHCDKAMLEMVQPPVGLMLPLQYAKEALSFQQLKGLPPMTSPIPPVYIPVNTLNTEVYTSMTLY
jgi:hypothetical protein